MDKIQKSEGRGQKIVVKQLGLSVTYKINKLDYFWPVAEKDKLIISYWQPDWKKKRIKSSTIDQILISQDAQIEYIEGSTKTGGICGKGKTEILDEFPIYYKMISDHCPVYSSFTVFPDND